MIFSYDLLRPTLWLFFYFRDSPIKYIFSHYNTMPTNIFFVDKNSSIPLHYNFSLFCDITTHNLFETHTIIFNLLPQQQPPTKMKLIPTFFTGKGLINLNFLHKNIIFNNSDENLRAIKSGKGKMDFSFLEKVGSPPPPTWKSISFKYQKRTVLTAKFFSIWNVEKYWFSLSFSTSKTKIPLLPPPLFNGIALNVNEPYHW